MRAYQKFTISIVALGVFTKMSIMTRFFATAKGWLTTAIRQTAANDTTQPPLTQFRIDTLMAGNQIQSIRATHLDTGCLAFKLFSHGEKVDKKYWTERLMHTCLFVTQNKISVNYNHLVGHENT